MSPQLRIQLKRILLDRPDKPKHTGKVRDWLEDNGVTRSGVFDAKSFDRLEALLRAEGMDPYAAPDGSRASSWATTGSDKADAAVLNTGFVLVRAAPGRPLRLDGDLRLGAGMSLRMPMKIIVAANRHHSVMLVENQEAFDRLEHLSFTPACWADEPLIVFRGSPGLGMAGARIGAATGLPVHVFADIDPAGVQIAATTPGAIDMVLPPVDVIETLAARSRNADLYRKQIAWVTDLGADERVWVRRAFSLVTRLGCMVPQEAFLS